MRPLLYLDTARFGQMSAAAKDAQIDFVRLSAEEPSSLYFEVFLRDGFQSWPDRYQERFPGLATWRGVAGLKRSLRTLAGVPDSWSTLLAGRSLSLVHLATSCMFRVCRNVLTTDLSWPTYQHAVEQRASRTGNRITVVPLRESILRQKWTTSDVASFVATAFLNNKCDGLFLPAVDHLGIRLPIREIVGQIEKVSELRFCFIDAAQAFCHVPLDECVEFADFIVTGSHKWMGAYLPTGTGFFGQRRSHEVISRRLHHQLRARCLNDPLLHFTTQLDGGKLDGHSETANLASLFACAGAASDMTDSFCSSLSCHRQIVTDFLALAPYPTSDWFPIRPVEPMQSRIVLFDTTNTSLANQPADVLRQLWLDSGLVVTAYSGGRVRAAFSSRLGTAVSSPPFSAG